MTPQEKEELKQQLDRHEQRVRSLTLEIDAIDAKIHCLKKDRKLTFTKLDAEALKVHAIKQMSLFD